jgi:hypothetical protein
MDRKDDLIEGLARADVMEKHCQGEKRKIKENRDKWMDMNQEKSELLGRAANRSPQNEVAYLELMRQRARMRAL